MITHFRHTGLVVQDLDRSLLFYQGLGLKLQARKRESGAYIDSVVGLTQTDLEWAKLATPDGALVELIRYQSHPDPPTSRPANSHGCSHVAFTVTDMEEALSTLQFLGGNLVGEVATDPSGRHRVVYCSDPEGIILEIVEVVST